MNFILSLPLLGLQCLEHSEHTINNKNNRKCWHLSSSCYMLYFTCIDSFTLDHNPVGWCGTLKNMSTDFSRCLSATSELYFPSSQVWAADPHGLTSEFKFSAPVVHSHDVMDVCVLPSLVEILSFPFKWPQISGLVDNLRGIKMKS